MEPPFQFTVLEDFECEELDSHYVKDLSYTCHQDNDKLIKLVPKWIKEGKIEIGGQQARISGVVAKDGE